MIPVLKEFEQEKVDAFSVAMFFSAYISELLKDIDDKGKTEVIIRYFMDGFDEV